MSARQHGGGPMTAALRFGLAVALAGAMTAPLAAADRAPDTPELVLDGTDLVALDEVAAGDLPQPLEGRYAVEQGGSMLGLSLTAQSGDGWVIRRSHEEPGVSMQVKTYTAERRGTELVSSDGSVVVRGSGDGVVALERASGLDSIPPDYWIRYYPED